MPFRRPVTRAIVVIDEFRTSAISVAGPMPMPGAWPREGREVGRDGKAEKPRSYLVGPMGRIRRTRTGGGVIRRSSTPRRLLEVIPADRWHDPYMDARELGGGAPPRSFWGSELEGALVSAMGLQAVGDVDLIRHAYVHREPAARRRPGAAAARAGPELAARTRRHLGGCRLGDPLLRRHGFELASPRPQASCSRGTGRSRSARSRHRSCSPIRRSTPGRHPARDGSLRRPMDASRRPIVGAGVGAGAINTVVGSGR